MKKKLATTLLSLATAAAMLCSGSTVYAVGTSQYSANERVSPRIGCATPGCAYQLRFVCYKSKYYTGDYDFTHGSCKVTVYESPYAGLYCPRCEILNTNGDDFHIDFSAWHACTQQHSSCGKGWVDDSLCLDGEIW